MDANDDWAFAAPPFQPAAALAGLARSLREAGLVERAGVWERRGLAVAKAAVDGDAIAAALVSRPGRGSADWQPRRLASAADVRDFVARLKRQLAHWSDRDD